MIAFNTVFCMHIGAHKHIHSIQLQHIISQKTIKIMMRIVFLSSSSSWLSPKAKFGCFRFHIVVWKRISWFDQWFQKSHFFDIFDPPSQIKYIHILHDKVLIDTCIRVNLAMSFRQKVRFSHDFYGSFPSPLC